MINLLLNTNNKDYLPKSSKNDMDENKIIWLK